MKCKITTTSGCEAGDDNWTAEGLVCRYCGSLLIASSDREGQSLEAASPAAPVQLAGNHVRLEKRTAASFPTEILEPSVANET